MSTADAPDHVTDAELDEVEHWHAILVSGSSSASRSQDAQDQLSDLGCSLLPRLAAEHRAASAALTAIGHSDESRGTATRIAETMAHLHSARDALTERTAERDALAATVERLIREASTVRLEERQRARGEQDEALSAAHQRAIDRATQLEKEVAGLRALVSDADRVKDENETLRARVRELEGR